jgi:hypothetical protein
MARFVISFPGGVGKISTGAGHLLWALLSNGSIDGISPNTNKPMHATPADASLTMKFNEARVHAAKLDAHGHKDWRVPTKAELKRAVQQPRGDRRVRHKWFHSRRLVPVLLSER